MASVVARAYNKGLGAECPAGSRGKAPGQRVKGAKPPEAKGFLVFGRSMEAANLPTSRNFGNTKASDVCVIFAKNYGWPRNWGGGCAPSSGPKTATGLHQ